MTLDTIRNRQIAVDDFSTACCAYLTSNVPGFKAKWAIIEQAAGTIDYDNGNVSNPLTVLHIEGQIGKRLCNLAYLHSERFYIFNLQTRTGFKQNQLPRESIPEMLPKLIKLIQGTL